MTASTAEFAPLSYPNDQWTCPVTGLVVHKARHRWAQWRADVWKWAEANQEAAFAASRASIVWWCNAFAWTYKPLRSVGGARKPAIGVKDRPFLTWPCQDRAFGEIEDAIRAGESIGIRKSRDMGATWMLMALATHRLLFHRACPMMAISRVEDDVDKTGDSDTLFSKVDFLLDHLPEWMTGTIERTHLHFRSLRTGSVLDGRSTSKDVARGGRREFIIVDEAAAIPHLSAVDIATADATSCRIFNTTPKAGTFAGKLYRSGKIRVVVLPWWEHPEKGAAGRQLTTDPRTGKTVVDGPWRQHQIAQRVSARDIAENIDMDEEGAGLTVFDALTLSRQIAIHARPPLYRGRLSAAAHPDTWEAWLSKKRGQLQSTLRWKDDLEGPWRIWCDLEQDEAGRWRPSQRYVYVFGIDVAAGVGAANSVICVLNRDTGEQVGEFACNETDPHALAEQAAIAAHWFGGRQRQAFIAWETNGAVGRQFTRRIRAIRGLWLYQQIRHDRRADDTSDLMGWTSDRNTKPEVLGELRNALSRDRFVARSREMLDEAGRYVYTESGTVDNGEVVDAEGPERHTHGDRVIAAAVCYEASIRLPVSQPPPRIAPVGSMQERKERREKDAVADPEMDY